MRVAEQALAGKLAKEASGESAATSLSTAETQLLIVGSKIVSRIMVIAILQLDKTPLRYAATFLGHLLPYSDKSKFTGSEYRIQLCEQLSYHVICQPIVVTPQLFRLHDRSLNARQCHLRSCLRIWQWTYPG